MIRFLARKWLFYAAAAYLVLATAGTSLFLSPDAYYFEDRADVTTDQGSLLAALVPALECPAISKTKDRSFSPSRQYLPRILIPISFFIAGAGFLCVSARFVAGVAAYNVKNTILLKLRI
jgi:hypothetical protein